MCRASVSSTAPRFEARWPPFLDTVSRIRVRISRARLESSSGESLRRSAGPRIESRILVMRRQASSGVLVVVPRLVVLALFGPGLELFGLELALLVLEQDLDLALGLVELGAEEP